MAIVQAVLGPIDTAMFERVLVHEHVRVSYPGDHLDPSPGGPTRADCMAVAVDRMAELLDHGVNVFVDPCPIDLGRDPELLAEVSQRSGMHIVCTTGFYHEHIGVPYYWRVRSQAEITELYLHEINQGIGATGIRPGAIKVATFDPVGDVDRKVLAAAADAAAASGLTVITHCENSVGGDMQQDALAAAGVDLRRCLIGHQDHALDGAQHLEIARRGSFVGIDRIGLEILTPEETRVDHVRGLVEAGYADQVCLSQDHMCCLASPKFPYPVPDELAPMMAELEPVVREQIYGRSHAYLLTDFVPRLVDAGVEPGVVEAMLRDNPRRLFGG